MTGLPWQNADLGCSVTANVEKRGDANDDKIIVGAKYGFATVDLKTGELSYIHQVWNEQDGPGKEERYGEAVLTIRGN